MRTLALLVVLGLGCTQEKETGPGNAAAAAAATPQTLTLTTSSPEARDAFEKGLAFADDRRTREAVDQFKRALALDPDFALAHAYLGSLTPGAEGTASLNEAARLVGKHSEGERLYVDYLRARHEGDDAKLNVARLELARKLPGDWRAQVGVGDQYYEEERWPLAIEAFQKAVRLNPRSSAYNPLGYSLAVQGKLDLAVEALRQYVKVRPGDPNPLDSLGEIELMAGNLDAAEKAFVRANEASGEYWEAWHGVAQARLLRGDVAGGTAAFERARASATVLQDKLQIDAAQTWALLAQGKADAALAKVDALERGAKDGKAELAWADAPLLRASLLIELGRPADALRHLELALDRAVKAKLPGLYAAVLRRRVLLRKVIAHADLGQVKEAEATLAVLLDEAKKAAVKAELRTALHLARAMVWKARGQLPAAIGELRRCDARAAYQYSYEGRPENAYCLYRLMRVQREAKDEAAAAATGEQILRAYVRDPVYVFVRSRVGPKHVANR